MKKRNKWLTAPALLLLGSLLLSGCGKDMIPEEMAESAEEWIDDGSAEKEEAGSTAEAGGKTVSYDVPLVGTATDYSNKDYWLMLPEKATKEVDTFFVYPTIITDTSEDAAPIVDIDNPIMYIGAYDTYVKNASAFEESTNVYAPLYRQSNMAAAANYRGEDLENFHKQEQRTDIYAALDYYFEHYNEGRPFFLAGHSQGSILLKIALEEYFRLHPEYYERMIAAYLVGFSVTKQDLEKYPHLKFAQGADDTGVLVSWNTEGPGNKNADNIVVEKDAISINPISWSLGDEVASAEDCPGSRTDDMAGSLEMELLQAEYDIKALLNEKTTVEELIAKVIHQSFSEDHPGIADAQVDPERGVVVCTTKPVDFMEITDPAMPDIFGPESYHSADYALYYFSIVDNVKTRIDSYFASRS